MYFIAGGCDHSGCHASNSTYFYNSKSKVIEESIKMPEKKYNFVMCYLNDYIYVFGGTSNKDGLSLKSCARFLIKT